MFPLFLIAHSPSFTLYCILYPSPLFVFRCTLSVFRLSSLSFILFPSPLCTLYFVLCTVLILWEGSASGGLPAPTLPYMHLFCSFETHESREPHEFARFLLYPFSLSPLYLVLCTLYCIDLVVGFRLRRTSSMTPPLHTFVLF